MSNQNNEPTFEISEGELQAVFAAIYQPNQSVINSIDILRRISKKPIQKPIQKPTLRETKD